MTSRVSDLMMRMAQASSFLDLAGESELADRMDKVSSSLIKSGLDTGDSDWFTPSGQKLEVDVPDDMIPDHWGKGRAFIPHMEEMGYQKPESDSFTDVIENLLRQRFLRKTTGYGRLTYTLGDPSLLSRVEDDIWDEVISANKSGRSGIENVMVDILIQNLADEDPDDVSVISFPVKKFIESGQRLSEFHRTLSPGNINSWVNQFSR